MWRAILIDDEENSLESLTLDLKKHCPDVEVIARCPGAREGMIAIRNHEPDLVFLDIEMPWMTGIEMLEVLGPVDFKVIFVTAYDQFAIQAFRLSALDYLLKPVDPEHLKKAVGRMGEEAPSQQEQITNLIENTRRSDDDKKIAIPTQEGFDFIKLSTIEYWQADGSYCTVHLAKGRALTISKPLSIAERILSPDTFCRVHHSYIVNLNKIDKYMRGDGGYLILESGAQIPVSRQRKAGLLEKIDKMV